MEIRTIQIQKFRSIDDATVTLRQILALVGANNVGKSHVLRALNAFFNYDEEKTSFLNQDHMYSKQSRPRITVTFDSICEEDEIPSEYIFAEKLTIKFTYRWDRKSPLYEVVVGNEKKTIDADMFKKLLQHFVYVYVPIIRDYNTAFSSDGGIAYKLLYQIFQQQTANRNNLQPSADKLIAKVEDSIYKPAISRINKYYPFKSNHKFSMQTHNADLIDLILRNVTLKLLEDSQENGIDNCGSGIQSAVFFAISMAISISKEGNYLVGIEEPELNMHPQAQRQLIEALQEKSRYPKTQFILTTHSTVFIDRIGHDCIALCRKFKGEKRDVVTAVTQISEGFWNKYDMEEERYYNFFDFKNSDFFFSNYIIITESTNDCKVVQQLLESSNIDIEELGISLIPSSGERSVKYPYAIAKELEIPFLCVVDRDVFQPYLNDKRENSLDGTGLPQYKKVQKNGSPVLELLSDEDKAALIECFGHENYKDVLSVLEKYHIITMKYAFEVDLVICPSYCDAMCDVLGVYDNRTYTHLLKDLGNVIKKYNIINETILLRGTQNLPKSYRQIINSVKEMVSKE